MNNTLPEGTVAVDGRQALQSGDSTLAAGTGSGDWTDRRRGAVRAAIKGEEKLAAKGGGPELGSGDIRQGSE